MKRIGTLVLLSVLFAMNYAFAQDENPDCDIIITKSAPGAGSSEFEFNGRDENGDTFSEFIADGGHVGFGVNVGTFTDITEQPQFGYRFGGIECLTTAGIDITQTSANSFRIDCQSENAQAECLVTNVPGVNIPTLSEWGTIAMAGVLGLIGLFAAARKRKAAA